MSAEHERAKALARAEAAQWRDRLPLTRRQELSDLLWATADVSERAALRAEYALAGWALCPHSTCPPHDCRSA